MKIVFLIALISVSSFRLVASFQSLCQSGVIQFDKAFSGRNLVVGEAENDTYR
jgi:hypothetical protein